MNNENNIRYLNKLSAVKPLNIRDSDEQIFKNLNEIPP